MSNDGWRMPSFTRNPKYAAASIVVSPAFESDRISCWAASSMQAWTLSNFGKHPKLGRAGDLIWRSLVYPTSGMGKLSIMHCLSQATSRVLSIIWRISLKAWFKLRRRRLNWLCEGIAGNIVECSFQYLKISVSISQPWHSPTKAIVISLLSLQSRAKPGRLSKGSILIQMSSTKIYIHMQKS